MEFGSLVCDQSSEVQVLSCNLCALDPPTNPVVTACGHYFCWPNMYKFLHGQAKKCPVCSTMLRSDVNVAPDFDTHGALVLRLQTAEEVEPSWYDDVLGWSGPTAFAPIAVRLREEPIARGDVDMAIVMFEEETKINGHGICV